MGTLPAILAAGGRARLRFGVTPRNCINDRRRQWQHAK